ncbi:MAG TPA: NAD(P)H-dependent oxidoreductase [Burkholderiaceae bacterium]|nr:NAD(P)H-dependent oxidoreductase [Burkholderiaceae bacterium]
MKSLLVVYHSMTGAAEQLALAAAAGAKTQHDIEVRVCRARDAESIDLLAADGYLFATPENLATMAGLMKDFFDRVYYAVLERVNGRPYAAIVAAGTDGAGAARQLQRIATGLRLREVAPPLVVRNGAQTPAEILAPKIVPPAYLQTARDLGTALAAGIAAGIF